jgi:hypothetical protein
MITGTLNPATNSADWGLTVEVTDYLQNDLIDLSSVTEITAQVRNELNGIKLSGTLTGGEIAVVDTGVFRFNFAASSMKSLVAGTYEVGITLVQDSKTLQVLLGQLPVLDGVIE